jgi:hypothetical protein
VTHYRPSSLASDAVEITRPGRAGALEAGEERVDVRRPRVLSRERRWVGLDGRLDELGELFLAFDVRVIAFFERVGLAVQPFF